MVDKPTFSWQLDEVPLSDAAAAAAHGASPVFSLPITLIVLFSGGHQVNDCIIIKGMLMHLRETCSCNWLGPLLLHLYLLLR